MKGIYKGVKYTLSQIFVVKEREIEIGYPTEVKHVAHIGWDGSSGSAPSWMNQFRTIPDFATTSIGNSGTALSPWSSSQDCGDPRRLDSEVLIHGSEVPGAAKKKPRRKKCKSTNSMKSLDESTRIIRKSKMNYVEVNAAAHPTPTTDIEVA